MNVNVEKSRKFGRYWLTIGVELRDWALPLHIDGQSGICVTVLCFYVSISKYLPVALAMARTLVVKGDSQTSFYNVVKVLSSIIVLAFLALFICSLLSIAPFIGGLLVLSGYWVVLDCLVRFGYLKIFLISE